MQIDLGRFTTAEEAALCYARTPEAHAAVIAIQAREKLEEMDYKFIKLCGHKGPCLCEVKGIGNVPLLPTNVV